MALYERIKSLSITEMQITLNSISNYLSRKVLPPNDIITHLSRDKKYVLDYHFWDMNYDYIKATFVPELDKVYKERKFNIIIDKCNETINKYQPAFNTINKIIEESYDYGSALTFIKPQLSVPEKYKTRVILRQGKYDKIKADRRDIYEIITLDDLIKMLQDQNTDDARFVLNKIGDFIKLLQMQDISAEEMACIMDYFGQV
jgi:hypothetical protein